MFFGSQTISAHQSYLPHARENVRLSVATSLFTRRKLL
jgi:hypothetical protein